MNKRFGRLERLAYWLSQPGNIETCLAVLIVSIVIFIFARYNMS